MLGSLERIYAEDLEQVLKLWQDTFDTNHIKILRDLVRAYRDEADAPAYGDVLGLCRVASRREIAEKNWSLNPGRYVGVAERQAEEFEFAERLEELHEEFEKLETKREGLRDRIRENISKLLDAL